VAVNAPIFTKFKRSPEGVVNRSCAGTELHENPTNGLLGYRQTNWWTDVASTS